MNTFYWGTVIFIFIAIIFCYYFIYRDSIRRDKERLRNIDSEVKEKIMEFWVSQTKRIQQLEKLARHWESNHDNMVKKCALLSQRDDLPVDRLPAYRELERLQREVALLEDALIGVREKAFQEVIDYANANYDPIWSAKIAGDIEAMKGKK